MKPTKRMTRRQMLRQTEKVVQHISRSVALFPCPPVDLQMMHHTVQELYHDFGGFSSLQKIHAREKKMQEVQEQLKLLQEYVKELKIEN